MFKAYQNIDISTTPSPSLTLQEINSNVEGYRCVGSGTNFTLTLTGSPLINMATFLLWEATITNPAPGNVTIFGNDMPTEFQTKKTLVTCTYDGSAWKVVFNISGDESGYIINANVASNAGIEFSKMEALTASKAVVTDGSGEIVTTNQLPNNLGGTGKDMSADTGVVKVSSGTFSASTIVNADIDASAAIAYSKLATLNTGQIVVGNAGVPTAVTMSGDATIDNTGAVTVSSSVGMFEPGAGTNSLKDKRATTSSGNSGTAIGRTAVNSGESGQAIGRNSQNTAQYGNSIGWTANNTALSGQSIGMSADNSGVAGQAIGYFAANRIDNSTNISGAIIIQKAGSVGSENGYWAYAGAEVIIMTDTFDAKTLGTQTIDFPTGVKMFVDEVGFIATTANTVTGQPELSYGVTGNNDALLTSTATSGVTTAGARDRQTSLVTDNGVTSLTVEVTVAAVATTLVGRAYFKGIIVEDQ